MAIDQSAAALGKMSESALISKVTDRLTDLLLSVPTSMEVESTEPEVRSNQLMIKAARKAAIISGGAAMVPGPLGLMTLLPDMVAIWQVQAQLVADIAAVHGKSSTLGKEQMVWCLFKHSIAHLARDFVVQVGERYIVRRQTVQFIQKAIGMLGVKIAQRLLGKTAARYIPFLGAAAVARYAFVDTKKVGRTAMALFGKDVVIQE